MSKPLFLFWPFAAFMAIGCAGDPPVGNQAADSALTNASSDPALNAALRGRIMTDPDLKADANAYAVRPADRPVDGGIPPIGTGAQSQSRSQSPAVPMPAAREIEGSGDAPRTLAGVARRGATATCAETLDYAMVWADRLPAALALYPGANLLEAAGNSRAGCNLRVTRFVASDAMEAVIDYYYQRARHAGYASDHQAAGDIHILSGSRRDGARYRLRATPHRGGGTEISLVTS